MAIDNTKKRGFKDLSHLIDPTVVEELDDVFDEPGDVVDAANKTEILPIDQLHSFKNHPFKVNTTANDFWDLVESIREHGILIPIIVRPSTDGYEIIAGHRRVAAAKMAGLTEVPVIIRALNDFEATIIMVHTNIAREVISHSEKAKAYRMCHDIGKHQGKAGLDTAEEIGKEHNDSKRQVQRYIRLSYLCEDLLEFVDSGKLAFNTGVYLAYLDEDSQQNLLVFIEQYKLFPSFEQAELLKNTYSSTKRTLSYEKIIALLVTPVKVKPITKVSFKTKEIASYFDEGTTTEVMSDTILMLLRKYRNGDFDAVIEKDME
ncbi:MAG: ParB/RepB/Spo0J family partition protein [Agathobacter sp.]|nr:ParB/RepB/Spo0J family partition protein [Agathobacter sp.]